MVMTFTAILSAGGLTKETTEKQETAINKIQNWTKKLLLLYTGPYVITKYNNNNTYEIMNPITKRIKGTYNQESIKKYNE